MRSDHRRQGALGPWRFDGSEWAAESALRADGVPLVWRIGVCEDGTFSVSESDSELTDRRETFATLAAAKEFCRVRDGQLEVVVQ